MTGADISRLVREARQRARRERRPINHADLSALLIGARPARSPPMRRRIAVHEVGHILSRVAYGLGTITHATIDGQEGHGYVETDFDHIMIENEAHCMRMLQVYLAGRAAEKVYFGETLAGSGGSEKSDLARATQLAYAMEASMGFGATTPLLYRDIADCQVVLRFDPDIAERVHGRLEVADADVCNLIRRNHSAIGYLVGALLHHGTLEGSDLKNALEIARSRMKEGEIAHRERATPTTKD